MTGPGTLFYPNGQPYYIGDLFAGEMHGRGEYFNEKGKVIYSGEFIHGERLRMTPEIENMSAFDTGIRQIFEGKSLWSDLLPWYYTPKFILMTIPIAVILGMVLFFIFCWRKKEDRFWSFC